MRRNFFRFEFLFSHFRTNFQKLLWMDVLLKDLKTPDILVQLNAVELLAELKTERVPPAELLGLLKGECVRSGDSGMESDFG